MIYIDATHIKISYNQVKKRLTSWTAEHKYMILKCEMVGPGGPGGPRAPKLKCRFRDLYHPKSSLKDRKND